VFSSPFPWEQAMNLALNQDLEKLIQNRIDSGQYSTPEDVVAAAMIAWEQQEAFGDFEPGELKTLLAEGDRSIREHGSLDGEEAFRARRERRAAKFGSSQ